MSIIATTRTVARHRRLNRAEMLIHICELETANAKLRAECNRLADLQTRTERDLDNAAIDLSSALDDKRIAEEQTARVKEALTATESELANATAVSQLPQHISTQPIPVLPLHQSPLANPASPANVPTWARGEGAPTQPLRTVDPAA